MVELKELFTGADAHLLDEIAAKINISNVYDLAANTNEISERSALADGIGCPKHILYYYAKLADLLQCPDISMDEAVFMVQTGIRCVNDLYYLNTAKYLDYISEYGYTLEGAAVDTELVNKWVEAARLLNKRDFQCEPSDPQNSEYTYYSQTTAAKKASTTMGVDLKDIISELGAGLADAQKALDLNSIAVQREILADPMLRAYGLNATWFTIPETTFSLKMTYTFSEGKDLSGSGAVKNALRPTSRLKMRVVPSNATFNNTYKSAGTQESTLTLRFVPIPPPEGSTDRVEMPDLVGLSVDEAVNALAELNLEYDLVLVDGEPSNGQDTEVLRQSLSAGSGIEETKVAPGDFVLGRSRITLTYTDGQRIEKGTESAPSSPALSSADEKKLKNVLDEAKKAASAAAKSAEDAKNAASSADTAAKNASASAESSKKFAASAEEADKNAAINAESAKKSAANSVSAAKNANESASSAKESAEKAESAAKAAENAAKAMSDTRGVKSWGVKLTDAGDSKIAVIKIVREISGLGLAEAKKAVENPPYVVSGLTSDQAQIYRNQLENAGASAEIMEV